MPILVDTLPTGYLSRDTQHQQLLSKNDLIIYDKNKLSDSLSSPYESFRLFNNKEYSDNLIVLWFGEIESSLQNALMRYLNSADVTLICLSTEEKLWSWLNTHSSSKVATLIIETNNNIQDIVSRSIMYASIRSILIRCSSNNLNILQQYSRLHLKVTGVFADDVRLLFKLVIDLAHYSEEIGDQQRENEHELKAQRSYDRVLRLCALARKL